MALLFHLCLMLICCGSLTLTLAVIPCNDQHADCHPNECCAALKSAPEGYRGECRKYKTAGQPCVFGEKPEGDCGCGHGTICVGSITEDGDDVTSCNVILPGRRY